MENALDIIRLNKVYKNKVLALDNISLSVKKGDLFAFLGPNGAGKSTVIGIISSLVRITSGEVLVFGKNVQKNPDFAKRNIGLVPQEYNLNQFIPIEETMINVAGYFGINKDEAEKRTYKLFNQLGIWNKRKNTPRELSGGMKRRLMIARALIHDPKLLILDEPTAGVDTELRLTMWDFFQELNSKGVTIILTTHYLEEAERLCKNLAIIHKGSIIQHSSMNEVFQMRKKHTYIIKTSNNITGDLISDDLVFKTIDSNTCEITVDNEVSITKIIEKLKDININVLNIISKRNRLEELFMELTKEEIIL
ncbi:MAG: ABC transporter ATP-binding protein [Pelagibacterales bacterium]|nr:ABC transporter ATP-binding protein [Pelagibacterales bacterium]|tara:strand:- start:870 stop:1793 length:924 start_codon:yes stop_codon:yes gene_type:complete